MSQHIITDADVSLENQTFSLEALAELINEMGVTTYIEHSGGGHATLYVGAPYVDEHGDERYTLIAGPGVMSDIISARFEDFSVAADNDGEGDSFDFHKEGLSTLREMATYIAQAAREA